MTLIELRDRLAAATGPSFDLDCKIEHLFEPERARQIGNPRSYTASIDAAVTLVPEGLWWCVDQESNASATLSDLNGAVARIQYAASPALALCLARLEFEIAKLEER